jgi:hypothetical protein
MIEKRGSLVLYERVFQWTSIECIKTSYETVFFSIEDNNGKTL